MAQGVAGSGRIGSKAVSGQSDQRSAKLIAMFFTQFHAIPENDEWWGKGFTDWDNVKSGIPQYDGHYQPRVPRNGNYYDQSQLGTLRGQIDIAKEYGVYGFCHYHYWFDGKQLLDTPTNLIMANRDIDFPFCLSWANETWSRRWDGRNHHILIKQTHPPTQKSWKRHYDYLIKAWTDPRAIKVEGKPVFVIYRPNMIEKIDEMLAYWRELAHQEGLPGLYFIFQKQGELATANCLNSFDALFQFQPFEAINSPTYDKKSVRHSPLFKLVLALPEYYQDLLRDVRAKFCKELTLHDYDMAWRQAIAVRPDEKLTTFPGAFVDWDNTARYKNRATIYRGASPESFCNWLAQLVDTLPQRNLPEDFIFLNAWNEWSEGAYLEPDERYGFQYLEALRRALTGR
jgi:lipopolysaccharide biosynthesis protein